MALHKTRYKSTGNPKVDEILDKIRDLIDLGIDKFRDTRQLAEAHAKTLITKIFLWFFEGNKIRIATATDQEKNA